METTFNTLSVVIPVYNEENYIVQTLERALRVDSLGLRKEVIVVDDKSSDNTWEVLASYVRRKKLEKQVKLLQQPVNRGKDVALKRGFKEMTGEIVIVQDADLEYNPNDYIVFGAFFALECECCLRIIFYIQQTPSGVLLLALYRQQASNYIIKRFYQS